MLSTVAGLIRSKGEGLVQAIGALAQQLLGRTPLGPIVGGLFSLIGAVLELRTKAQKVKTDPHEPLRVFPVNSNYDLAANPATALFGLRGVNGAAAYNNAALLRAQLELSLKGDFAEFVTAKVASVLGGQNTRMAPE